MPGIVADPQRYRVQGRTEQVEQLAKGGFITLGDPPRQLAFGGRTVGRGCLAAGGLGVG
jgi:hypothetical protein